MLAGVVADESQTDWLSYKIIFEIIYCSIALTLMQCLCYVFPVQSISIMLLSLSHL